VHLFRCVAGRQQLQHELHAGARPLDNRLAHEYVGIGTFDLWESNHPSTRSAEGTI
jgi:hypothetical protein